LCLQYHPREPFGVRGEHKNIQLMIHRRHLFVRNGPKETRAGPEQSFETRSLRAVARDNEAPVVCDPVHGRREVVQPFRRLQSSNESELEVGIERPDLVLKPGVKFDRSSRWVEPVGVNSVSDVEEPVSSNPPFPELLADVSTDNKVCSVRGTEARDEGGKIKFSGYGPSRWFEAGTDVNDVRDPQPTCRYEPGEVRLPCL